MRYRDGEYRLSRGAQHPFWKCFGRLLSSCEQRRTPRRLRLAIYRDILCDRLISRYGHHHKGYADNKLCGAPPRCSRVRNQLGVTKTRLSDHGGTGTTRHLADHDTGPCPNWENRSLERIRPVWGARVVCGPLHFVGGPSGDVLGPPSSVRTTARARTRPCGNRDDWFLSA